MLVPVVVLVLDETRVTEVAVSEELTVIDRALDVLVAYVLDPPYVAVIEYVPAVLKVVLKVATPELIVAEPSEVVPL